MQCMLWRRKGLSDGLSNPKIVLQRGESSEGAASNTRPGGGADASPRQPSTPIPAGAGTGKGPKSEALGGLRQGGSSRYRSQPETEVKSVNKSSLTNNGPKKAGPNNPGRPIRCVFASAVIFISSLARLGHYFNPTTHTRFNISFRSSLRCRRRLVVCVGSRDVRSRRAFASCFFWRLGFLVGLDGRESMGRLCHRSGARLVIGSNQRKTRRQKRRPTVFLFKSLLLCFFFFGVFHAPEKNTHSHSLLLLAALYISNYFTLT